MERYLNGCGYMVGEEMYVKMMFAGRIKNLKFLQWHRLNAQSVVRW